MANTANYFRLDARNGTVGVDLTAANIPTRSVTKGSGTIAKYFDDAAGRRWFRFQVAASVNGQFRTNANLVANNQSFRARMNVATAPITTTRLILGVRATSTSVGRVSMTPNRQLELAAATSDTTGTVLGTTTISGGLPATDDFEVTLDTIVGTTTSNGVITLKVYPAGSNTPYSGGTVTSTTANLGTIAIQHYDVGSNQTGVSQAIDLRYSDVQYDTNRDGSILAYAAAPTGNYDIIVGWGQSNMAGPVYNTDAVYYDANGEDAYPSNVYEFRNGFIVPAQEPLWSPDLNNAGMGAGNTFLKDYAASSLASGRQVLMVMTAYRGTGYATPSSGENTAYSWRTDTTNDGTNLYENAKTRVTAALAAAGSGSAVKAIIANHGSTDGTNNSPKATFKAALQDAITSFRTWLGLPNVPFVMMQMRPDLIANENRHKIIADAQAETADELPSVMYALSPVGSTYYKSDSVHFNVVGQRQIGHNLYAQFIAPTQGTAATSFSTSTSATGSITASGSASTALIITTYATGSKITSGSSQTNLTLSTAATGSAPVIATNSGSASATFTTSTSATGSKTVSGSASTTFATSTAASGSTIRSGSSTTGFTTTTSATGSTSTSGTATTTFSLSTLASGTAPVVGGMSGSAATSVSLTTTAAGSTNKSGTAAALISFLTSGGGSRASQGVSSTAFTTTLSASGSAPGLGTNSGSSATTFTTSVLATGSANKGGTSVATFNLTTTASGLAQYSGASATSFHFATFAYGAHPTTLKLNAQHWVFDGESWRHANRVALLR